MSTALAQKQMDPDALLKLALGDTSKLNPSEKMQLIVQVCELSGLDPRLSPFEFIKFQGKEVMYARKNAADQLVRVHGINVTITERKIENGAYRVGCRAVTKDGRGTEDDGVVWVDGLKGDALANAMMKAVTKAKRRTVLSVCGLSMLDESEMDTIPAAREALQAVRPHVEVLPPAPKVEVLDPGMDPPAMDVPPPEEDDGDEELDIVTATRLRIQATKTLAALLVVGGDIKRMPAEVRESLRQDYADQQARIKEGK